MLAAGYRSLLHTPPCASLCTHSIVACAGWYHFVCGQRHPPVVGSRSPEAFPDSQRFPRARLETEGWREFPAAGQYVWHRQAIDRAVGLRAPCRKVLCCYSGHHIFCHTSGHCLPPCCRYLEMAAVAWVYFSVAAAVVCGIPGGAEHGSSHYAGGSGEMEVAGPDAHPKRLRRRLLEVGSLLALMLTQ